MKSKNSACASNHKESNDSQIDILFLYLYNSAYIYIKFEIDEIQWKTISLSYSQVIEMFMQYNILVFVCMFEVFLPLDNFHSFEDVPIAGCFWSMLGTYDHWLVRVL